MSLGTRLELRQTTQLVMTQQLRQAISLLQYNNLELSGQISAIVEQNPLLSFDEGAGSEVEAKTTETVALENLLAKDTQTATERDLDAPRSALHDEAIGDHKPAATGLRGNASSAEFTGNMGLEAPKSRLDGLLAQIGMMRGSILHLQVACILAAELDDAGYLRTSTAEMSGRIGIRVTDVDAGLALLQACEPTGVGARNLTECLGLQLAEQNALSEPMRALLDNIDLVAEGETDTLCRITGVDLDALQAMLERIRQLDPRPGLADGEGTAQVVVPDLIVDRDGLGLLRVRLNADTLPKVLIDRNFASRFDRKDAELKTYISNCRTEASWLVRSLEQRANTVINVATEILKQQEGFFLHGISRLKPMTLRQVADEIGMHESTISRVTSSKYLSCERGLFSLKFFFSQGLLSVDGAEVHSAESIRGQIRAMIEAEAPNNVLSDDSIVETLGKSGIKVARRTVAKYRDGMNIPSSMERRKQYRNPLRAGARNERIR